MCFLPPLLIITIKTRKKRKNTPISPHFKHNPENHSANDPSLLQGETEAANHLAPAANICYNKGCKLYRRRRRRAQMSPPPFSSFISNSVTQLQPDLCELAMPYNTVSSLVSGSDCTIETLRLKSNIRMLAVSPQEGKIKNNNICKLSPQLF